jgi:hypothetical protein
LFQTLSSCYVGKTNSFQYKLNGKFLCQKAFIRLTGFGKRKVQDTAKSVKTLQGIGNLDVQHGNCGKKKAPKKENVSAMLTNYISMVGDYQPDNHEIHMPCCLKTKELLNLLKVK